MKYVRKLYYAKIKQTYTVKNHTNESNVSKNLHLCTCSKLQYDLLRVNAIYTLKINPIKFLAGTLR